MIPLNKPLDANIELQDIYPVFNMFFSLLNRSLDTLIDYNGHRESTYVMVNRRKNVAKHLSENCRIRDISYGRSGCAANTVFMQQVGGGEVVDVLKSRLLVTSGWDTGKLYKPGDFCIILCDQCFLNEWMVLCGQADE